MSLVVTAWVRVFFHVRNTFECCCFPSDNDVIIGEMYESEINEWRFISPMPRKIFDAVAVVTGSDSILVLGGTGIDSEGKSIIPFLTGVLEYKPSTDTWSECTWSLPFPKCRFRAIYDPFTSTIMVFAGFIGGDSIDNYISYIKASATYRVGIYTRRQPFASTEWVKQPTEWTRESVVSICC